MFEKFLSANSADFRQRYEGTFGFFRNEEGKKLLVQLVSVRDNKCDFVGDNGQTYSLVANAEKDVGFEFIPPKSSFYNGDTRAMLVGRIAARQFRRGIHQANTSVQELHTNGKWLTSPIGFNTLKKVYLDSKSPKEAFSDWDKRDSVALSPQFAVSVKTPKIYVFDEPIGTYKRTDRHFSFKLDEPDLWRTELTDALKDLDCTVEVT